MKTTINLDDDLLKLVKLKAIDNDTTMTDLISLYLKNGLINHNKLKKLQIERQYNRKIRKLKN